MSAGKGLPPVIWTTSSYSGSNGGQCVEVGEGLAEAVPVRDSKDPQGPVLTFSASAWSSFVAAVKDGELHGG